MSEDLIKRSDAAEVVYKALKTPPLKGVLTDTMSLAIALVRDIPSADRPKHYCAECKYEPIDKRCMPCSSCTNNPKNRDAFVSCEVEKKGADDERN